MKTNTSRRILRMYVTVGVTLLLFLMLVLAFPSSQLLITLSFGLVLVWASFVNLIIPLAIVLQIIDRTDTSKQKRHESLNYETDQLFDVQDATDEELVLDTFTDQQKRKRLT